MRRLLDRLSERLARLLLSLFFRHVEVEGAGRVPRTGPLLVVANHPNGLVDPVLLLGVLPRPVRFLAKSTLWEMVPLRPFLALGGVIPVHRPTDPGADASKNEEMFARCHEALIRGEAVAIFPEGTSHSDPSLRPLKTGAARIALGAAGIVEDRAEAEPVRILPIGLAFDARERFRSRALLTVGHPLVVDPASGEPADREGVRRLTEAIRDGLADVSTEFRSWREARLFERAVTIYDRPPSRALPGDPSLARVHRTARELAGRFRELQRRHPEAAARVARSMARYDRILSFLSLRDDQVAARYPVLGVARFTVRTLLILLLGLPLAAVGAVLNLLPFLAVGRLADRPDLTLEARASWKLFGGIFAYPVFWALQAVLVGKWLGAGPGVGAALAAPLSGYVTLVFWERGARLWREARSYLMLRTRPRIRHRLEAMRASLRRLVGDLAARLEDA